MLAKYIEMWKLSVKIAYIVIIVMSILNILMTENYDGGGGVLVYKYLNLGV